MRALRQLAILIVLTHGKMQDLWHDPGRHNIICPNAPIDQLPRDSQIFGSVKHLGPYADSTSKVALEMFPLGLQVTPGRRPSNAEVPSKENISAVFGHRAEKQAALHRLHEGVVHSTVLVRLPSQQHVLFREVLICRVSHSTDGEPGISELQVLSIDHHGPHPRYVGCLLSILEKIRYPLDSIKVFGVLCKLR